MPIEIRPYEEADRDAWMCTHAIIMSTSHSWNYVIQERPDYAGYESTRLVAMDGEDVIGLTDIQYEKELGELCFNKDSRGGYVLEFGRLPEYTGHRIGEKLIEASKEDALTKGVHRLEYWSQDRKAQRFYRRIGFPEIGRHYRFRMKAPESISAQLLEQHIGVEYIYGMCQPEDWPAVKAEQEVLHKAPLEPHLCIGYEIRF